MLKGYMTSQALKDTINIVRNLLIDAGLVEGLSLTPEQIKTTVEPIFWHITTRSKDASDKPLYVTFNINELAPYNYGDGKVLARKPSVITNIYSRSRNVDELIENLNKTYVDKEWTFELRDMGFDAGLQMYSYTFLSEAVIVDE